MLLSYVFQGFCVIWKSSFCMRPLVRFFVNDVREGLGGRDRTKRANIFSSVRTHFFEVYSLSKIMEVENFPKQKETKIGDIQFPTSMIMRGRAFPSSMFFLNFLENTGTPEKSIRMPSRRRKRQSIAWRIKRSSWVKLNRRANIKVIIQRNSRRSRSIFSTFFSLKQKLIFKDTLKNQSDSWLNPESLLPKHHFWGPC